MSLYVKNKNRKTVLTSLIFALAIGMLSLGWFDRRPVFAQSANFSIQQISLSASLFNNESHVIPNGTYEVRFGIYTTDRALADAYPSNTDVGSRLWEETQTVTVKNGIFRVFLGSVIPLPDTLNFESGEYFIGMRIGTDSEMVPRKRLGSVPRAVNSQFLQGRTIGTQSGNIPVLGSKGKLDIRNLPTGTGNKQLVLGNDARLGDSHQQNTDTGTDADTFNIGSGTAATGTNFDLTISSAAAPPALRYNGTTASWQLSNNGSSFSDIVFGSTPVFDSVTTNGQGAIRINPYGTLAGTTGELRFYELSANGTNYVGLKGPDSIASDLIWTLPNADGTSNQVLTTDGAGTLVWQTAGAGVGAPTGATYLTLSNDSSLSAERVLTGNSQITVTDGGANSSATLSITADSIGDTELAFNTGQTLTTAASPSFTGLTLSGLSTAGIVTNTSGGVLGTAATLGASYITADSIDFAQFIDTMTLDASTDISITGSNVFSLTNTGTGNSLVVNDQAADTTPFMIDAAGNVGVGTASPAVKLDVDGAIRSTGFVSPASGQGVLLEFSGGEGFVESYDYTGLAYLPLYVDGSTLLLNAASGGNVGIGDTSPASLLTVGSGDLFQVNSSGAIAAATGITNTGAVTSTGGIVNLNVSSNFATNINTGTSMGAVTIGGGSNAFAIDSTTLDISTAGAITGATGVTSSGTITFSGLSTAGIVTNTSGGVLGTAATLGASYITADSLDYTEFQDTLDLDSTLTLNQGTNLWSQTYTGTTGIGQVYIANSLTSGRANSLESTATGLTGNLQFIYLAGSSAGNTGNLLRLDDGGALNATTPFKLTANGAAAQVVALIENTGSGTSFRVNDGAADTTPFIIDAAGNVGIGTTTPGARLNVVDSVASDYAAEIFNDGNAASNWGLLVQSGLDDGTAAGPSTLIQFNDGDGGAIGSITFGSSVTNYNTSSDARLKENITETLLGIDDLMGIRVRDYEWKSDSENKITHGFIAQELQTVYPQAVTVPTDPTKMWQVDYSKLTPLIVKAVQDQQGEIESQKINLTDIDLKTDQNITTLAELQASVDAQLTLAGTELSALTEKDTEYDANFLASDTRLTALETLTAQIALDMNARIAEHALLTTQMATLTEQVQTLTDFFTTFSLGTLVSADAQGNVDLLGGILKARILETGGLVIENVEADAPTIGTTSILPPAEDADNDGNDDFSDKPMSDPEVAERDGTIVRVMTRAMVPMVKGSKIFTSFKDNPGAFTWIEKIRDEQGDYVGFEIRLSAPTAQAVKVDWWLVAEK